MTDGVRVVRAVRRRLVANACTSLLVGRRDPLGVGRRPAVEPVAARSRVVRTRGDPTDSPDGMTYGAEPRFVRVRPVASAGGNLAVGPSADSGPARLLAAVFLDRLRTRRSATL